MQTVSEKANPRYYNLISEFEKLTGVLVVLNTSFNGNGPTEEDCERYFEELDQSMNSLASVRPNENVLPDGFVLPGNLVRLQVVHQQGNPLFWRLLKRFGEIAPAPVLVNTSFNLFGEPSVVKPRDAVRSYFCSGSDPLVIDNFVLSKTPAKSLPVLMDLSKAASSA